MSDTLKQLKELLNSMYEMATLGKVDGYLIQLNSEDHDPAHFHLVGNGLNIRIQIPNTVPRNNAGFKFLKSSDKDKVPQHILTDLRKWLKSKHTKTKTTNLIRLIDIWDTFHNKYE